MEPITFTITEPELLAAAQNFGSTTIAEAVLHLAATEIVEGLRLTERVERNVAKQIGDLVRVEASRQVQPVVAEALTKPLQRTNSYGEAIGGEGTTLREIIVEQASQQLVVRGSGQRPRSTSDQTTVEKFITEQIGKALTVELREAVADTKAKCVALVRSKTSEVIAEVLERMAK